MRLLIENYNSNKKQVEILTEKFNKIKYNTKISAAYGLNTGGSKGGFSSKVENKVIEHITLESLLKQYKRNVNIVDAAEKILTNAEKEVITYLKLGITNKLSVIARLMKRKKKYVFDTRNRSIKKMCEYIGDKNEI